jgi:hypothetical protein
MSWSSTGVDKGAEVKVIKGEIEEKLKGQVE